MKERVLVVSLVTILSACEGCRPGHDEDPVRHQMVGMEVLVDAVVVGGQLFRASGSGLPALPLSSRDKVMLSASSEVSFGRIISVVAALMRMRISHIVLPGEWPRHPYSMGFVELPPSLAMGNHRVPATVLKGRELSALSAKIAIVVIQGSLADLSICGIEWKHVTAREVAGTMADRSVDTRLVVVVDDQSRWMDVQVFLRDLAYNGCDSFDVACRQL